MTEEIEYRTKYYNYYKEDNALHYLRLHNLNGNTKQKIIDLKEYFEDHHSNASMFKMWYDYDVENRYGCFNQLIRFIFDELYKATIIYLEAVEDAFIEKYDEDIDEYIIICDHEIFDDLSQQNSYWGLCNQLDYIIQNIDDNIIIPEINYEIVDTFYNYDKFDFGAYEAEEKYARM